MKFNKYLIAAVLSVSFLGATTGCKLITAAPTPGVTQFYSQAALVLNDASGILLQAQRLFTTAHSLGQVSDVDYQNGQKAFLSIAQNGDAVQVLLKAGGDQATITAQLNALILQAGQMPATFGIKDPTAQAQFTTLFASIQSIFSASLTLVK